jgi:DNA polymerase III subunit delta
VAEPELKAVYLLTGSDRPKIAVALGRLRRRFDADAVEHLSATQTSGAEAVAACNALGLFGASRLVLVDEVERWKAPDAKAIGAYLASPTPGTVLALIAGELRKDSALAKAVAKVGEVLRYDVDRKHVADWLVRQFESVGVEVDPAFCRSMLELIVPEGQEADLDHLANEVAKLATWANGEPLTWARARPLLVPFGEVPAFALTDAWQARDAAAMLRAAEAIFDREPGSRRDVTPRLVGALARHLGRLQQCKRMAGEGLRPQEMAARLKRHPFYVQKLARAADELSAEELRDAVVRLGSLDLALKGDSRLPADLELERALLDLGRGRQAPDGPAQAA